MAVTPPPSPRSDEPSSKVVKRAPKKKAEGQAPSLLALKLGNQIRRPDVERHAGGERQAVLLENRELLREQRAEETRDGERGTGGERGPPALSRRQEQARDREPFRQLVQQDRDEHEQPQRVAHSEPAGDGHAIHEGVHHQSGEGREAHELRDLVELFAEMEMRRQRVLGEVNQEVADQDHDGRGFPVKPDRVGREIEQRHRHHESGRERHHVVEGADAPAGARDDRNGADDVGARGDRRVDESGSVQERTFTGPVDQALPRSRLRDNDKEASIQRGNNGGHGNRAHDCRR